MIITKNITRDRLTAALPTTRYRWFLKTDTMADPWNSSGITLGPIEQVIVYTGSSNDYPDFLGGTETSYDPHIEKSKYSVKNMRLRSKVSIYRDPFSWSGPAPTITIYRKLEKYNYNLNGSLNSAIITYQKDSSAWTPSNIIPNSVMNNNHLIKLQESFENPFGNYRSEIQAEDIAQASCDLNITDPNYGFQASEIVFS